MQLLSAVSSWWRSTRLDKLVASIAWRLVYTWPRYVSFTADNVDMRWSGLWWWWHRWQLQLRTDQSAERSIKGRKWRRAKCNGEDEHVRITLDTCDFFTMGAWWMSSHSSGLSSSDLQARRVRLDALDALELVFSRHGFDCWSDRIGNFFLAKALDPRLKPDMKILPESTAHWVQRSSQRWMNIIIKIETGTERVKKTRRSRGGYLLLC